MKPEDLMRPSVLNMGTKMHRLRKLGFNWQSLLSALQHSSKCLKENYIKRRVSSFSLLTDAHAVK